jgi:hypothetical protein
LEALHDRAYFSSSLEGDVSGTPNHSLLAEWNRDMEALLLVMPPPPPPPTLVQNAGELEEDEGSAGEGSNRVEGEAEDRVELATRLLAWRFLDCVRQVLPLLLLLAPTSIGDTGEAVEEDSDPQGSARDDVRANKIESPLGRDLEVEAAHLLSALRRRRQQPERDTRPNTTAQDSLGERQRQPPPVEQGRHRRPPRDDRDFARALGGLSAVAQAGKNWLRYLLVYHPASDDNGQDYRQEFQTLSMLRLYLHLLDRFLWYDCDVISDHFNKDQASHCEDNFVQESDSDGADRSAESDAMECARCTSLMLFYATFDAGLPTLASSPVASTLATLPPPHRSIAALIKHDGGFYRLLRYLLNARTSAVAVTVARNVHHFLTVACQNVQPSFANRFLEFAWTTAETADTIPVSSTETPSASSSSSSTEGETRSWKYGNAPWSFAAALWDPLHCDRLLHLERQQPDAGPSAVVISTSEATNATSPDAHTAATPAITFTYEATMVEILLWCMDDSNDEDQPAATAAAASTPSDRGVHPDRRSELALEILRILYVARFGRSLQGSKDDGAIPDHRAYILQRRTITILRLLELPTAVVVGDQLWWECQRSTIALLMDADHSFASVVVRHSCALGTILRTLDRLVSETVAISDESGRYVDPTAAAAALAPVLVVLHKFCQANSKFRSITQRHVFPPQPPDGSVSDLTLSTTTPGDDSKEPDRPTAESRDRSSPPARNIKPLDAPAGTVRANLIRLMTWPQSHIKRLSGELLWVLCDQDSDTFVRRVGLGNAIVVLGSKGIMSLPTQIFE